MLIRLTNEVLVAPQIGVETIAEAKAQGVTLIVNNRPEGEAPDQTPGDAVEAAARAEGLDYVAIPITHSGFSQPQVEAMAKALAGAKGKILAYCRSGTRSTNLWALAEASAGGDPDSLINIAAKAGYDISGIRPLMDMLKAKA